MKINVKRVNAFTDKIDGGNPAGVLFNSPQLTNSQMAFITKELKVSETAFVYPSNKADYKIRFFSPDIEVDLCGHATISTFYTMALENRLNKNSIKMETIAGILPIDIEYNPDGDIKKVMMTQAKPVLKDIFLDISFIADSLNISPEEINQKMPLQKVSTGLFTLPVCIKSYDVLKNMKPDFKKIKKICKENGFGSYHVFTFETSEPKSLYHARNFAPLYAIDEDPVTGTANGAVCSYLVKNGVIEQGSFVCEQGDITGRKGRVFVEIKNEKVRVGGIAKIVEEKEIEI